MEELVRPVSRDHPGQVFRAGLRPQICAVQAKPHQEEEGCCCTLGAEWVPVWVYSRQYWWLSGRDRTRYGAHPVHCSNDKDKDKDKGSMEDFLLQIALLLLIQVKYFHVI